MNWKTVSTLVTMVVVAGCQDNVASPTLQSASAPAAMSLAPQGRPQLSLNTASASNTSTDFTVGQNGGVFQVGRHAVYFPARSICDPATSGYGVALWSAPCTPASGPIKIHAVTRTQGGQTWVDFTPALRFVPSNDPSRWVWLTMSLPGAGASADLSRFNILYSPVVGGPLYDEAKTDPTLRTYVGRNVAARRIGHFTMYASSAGLMTCDTEDTNPPEECVRP